MSFKIDPKIKLISDVRKKIRPSIEDELKKYFSEELLRQKVNIIADALIYISLSKYDQLSNYSIKNDTIIQKLMDKNICSKLVNNLITQTITFENVLKIANLEFNIEYDKKHDIKDILRDEALKEKPVVFLAMQIYLLKGHFKWVNDSKSEFRKFLDDPDKKELRDDSSINCWEAVLYGMMKAELISKEDIQKYYSGGLFNMENKINGWFSSTKSTLISQGYPGNQSWREKMKEKPQFIMINTTLHDMMSVPYSQKQTLKMLIERKFDEEPSRGKIYSHWTHWTDGILGTVTKRDVDKVLKLGKYVRIVELNQFAQVGKKYIKNHEFDQFPY